MSQAKIREAQQVLVSPGPFDVAELTDPHDGARIAELEATRARRVVAWYRQILTDSSSLAEPELYTERLGALDAWLADEPG